MKIAVAAETRAGERRVALVPDLVPRLTDLGWDVAIEPGAGVAAGFTDNAYRSFGVAVDADALTGAAVVLSVRPLSARQAWRLDANAITVSFLPTAQELDLVRVLREAGITALAMELVPRISRAQSMDALSSQAFVAGYRAVLVAAERLPRFFPLSMTASGTIPPAKVLVLGAGVAGLQAVATARRLGALGVKSATIVVRAPSRAGEALRCAADVGVTATVTAWSEADFGALAADSAVVVNTAPAEAVSPHAAELAEAPCVLDVIYHPWPTPLAEAVERRGGRLATGLDMLLHQAFGQVELFTGQPAPTAAMRTALRAATGNKVPL